MDDATCAVMPPDPEMVQVGDAIWQRPRWRGLVQSAVLAGVAKVLVLPQPPSSGGARRRDIPGKATVTLAALRSGQLGQPPAVTSACAVTVRSLVAVITVLNEQARTLQGQVEADSGRHRDAEIYLSQPGLGPVAAQLR